LIVAQVNRLNEIMSNQDALKKLNVGFSKDIDSALDAYCAQLRPCARHAHQAQMRLPRGSTAGT
jgi:hypothetical protein